MMEVAPTEQSDYPPVTEHAAHRFMWANPATQVKYSVRCLGTVPHEFCPVFRGILGIWRSKYPATKRYFDDVERSRLNEASMYAPLSILRHQDHTTGSGRGTVICPGDVPNADCPHLHQLNRTWLDMLEPWTEPELEPVPVDDDLVRWWTVTTRQDIEQSIPKVREYGASDLQIMGDVMREWVRPETEWTPSQGVELSIGFYLLGKIARAVGAYRDGRLPSDDTIFDIYYYAMMIRRVRAVGGWPE